MSAMEVVIGFAVGYWVGTRQGRQGLQNALESAQAIWAHPETRKMLAEGTEAEGAAVALVTVPATITCQDCGLTAETTDVLSVCPGCAGENVEITGGDEMTLESITYEPARTG